MKQKAFTLIELLVVVGIVGILVSIVIVSLNSAKIKAKCVDGDDEACQELSQKQREDLGVYTEYPEEKKKKKKRTNLDKAREICPDGIEEFSGDPDDTWGEKFEVKCQ